MLYKSIIIIVQKKQSFFYLALIPGRIKKYFNRPGIKAIFYSAYKFLVNWLIRTPIQLGRVGPIQCWGSQAPLHVPTPLPSLYPSHRR